MNQPQSAAEIAHRLGAKRMQGYWLGKCPAHDDGKPSFSIREFEGRPTFRCFTGCSRDEIKARLSAMGIDLGTGGDLGWETAYAIRDADGKTVAEHVRIDRAGEGKVVFWRPKLSEIEKRVTEMPLYGTELLASRPGKAVVITEGEKAAEAVRRMEWLGLGTVTGAATAPNEAVLSILKGRKVYLWPDNDDEGRSHMARIAATLKRLEIRTITISWPDAPAKGDAADFVGLGRGRKELEALLPAPRVRCRVLADGIKPALSELDRFTMGDFSDRVPTGLATLDRRLRGGLRGGELVLLGAPTGSGKTTLVQQLAVAAARGSGRSVLFVSPEMSIEQLAEREIVRESRRELWDRNPWLNAGPLRDSCVGDHARAAAEIYAERLPIMVFDRTDVTMLDIIDVAGEIENLGLVVIDYAQQVASDTPNVPRYLLVGDVGSRGVELALKHDVPVIVASQVNTIKEGRSKMYTFRETQILEHKASVVLILDVEWAEVNGIRRPEKAEIVCTKNRSGPTFRLDVSYEPRLFRIYESDAQSSWAQYPLIPPAMPA